jgi:AcrR family transcriptional regulator
VKVTEAHVQARRAQILKAALSCFMVNGFQRTTMHDICREAALSPGAVYGYFKGKEDIVEALAALSTDRNRVLFAPIEQAKELTPRVIAAGLEKFVRLLEAADAGAIRIDIELVAESLHVPRLLQLATTSYEGMIAALSRVIQKGQTGGHIKPTLNPETTARLIFSTIQGLTVQKLLAPDLDLTAYAAMLAHVIEDTLSPD